MISMARIFFWPAVAGLVVCAVIHVSQLQGQAPPPDALIGVLGGGVFVVYFPTVVLARRMAKGASRLRLWDVVLRGCPTWLKYAPNVLIAYLLLTLFTLRPAGLEDGHAEWRLASAAFGTFYLISAAVYYSATHVRSLDRPKCPLGHKVAHDTKFCGECGAPVSYRD